MLVLNKSKKKLSSKKKKTVAILIILVLLSMFYKSEKISLGIFLGGCLSLLNIKTSSRIIENVFRQKRPNKALLVWNYIIKLLILFGLIYLFVTYKIVNVIAFIVGFSAFFFFFLIESVFPSRHSP